MVIPTEFETSTAEPGTPAPDATMMGAKSNRGRVVGVVTILTLIVAIVGYLREATLAARFGVTATMDAYFGAIFIPTNIYLILVVGTVSPILIPILLHDDDRDHARASESFSIITNFVLVLFGAVVICGMITARWWLAWLFPGFDAATQAMALKLIYIIFPALPLLALAGILTAALNGYHRYSLAAFAPALSSVAVIMTALVARGERAIYIVGLGTTFGFLLQFLVLVPATRSLGIGYRFIFRLRHPAIVRLVQLGSPLILYLLVANASLVVERNLASRLSAGALSSLTYAMRLFTVPSNFLAAPLAIVAYPYFAREALRTEYGELRQELARTVRLVVFLFVPITVWSVLNAVPVTRALYERGHFGIADSILVSNVFRLYAIGILPNAITVPLLRCFYAVEDTITPLWVESIDLAFFIVCAPLLTRRFGISGLAFMRGITFLLVATILVWVLCHKKGLLRIGRDFAPFIARIATATAVMAVVSWFGVQWFRAWFDQGGTLWRVALIGIQIVLDGAVFLATAILLKMDEAEQLLRTVLNLFQVAPQNASA
jgi:putative peptidoglycan lipid II flippase